MPKLTVLDILSHTEWRRALTIYHQLNCAKSIGDVYTELEGLENAGLVESRVAVLTEQEINTFFLGLAACGGRRGAWEFRLTSGGVRARYERSQAGKNTPEEDHQKLIKLIEEGQVVVSEPHPDPFINAVWCLISSMIERGCVGDDPWWGQDFLNVKKLLEEKGLNCTP